MTTGPGQRPFQHNLTTLFRTNLFAHITILNSAHGNTASLGTSQVLVLIARATRRSESPLSIGDLVLFVVYLPYVTELPGTSGGKLAWYKQVGVSVRRLLVLMPGAPPARLVAPSPPYAAHDPGQSVEDPDTKPEDALVSLDVTGLTYTYPESGRGFHDFDLHLGTGSFTVITSRVGSGKTTVLRALLGLLADKASGHEHPDGHPIGHLLSSSPRRGAPTRPRCPCSSTKAYVTTS